MKFGIVIGSVTATRNAGRMNGLRLALVRLLDGGLAPTPATLACTDAVGTGVGDVVLVCGSSSARTPAATRDAATDSSIVAVVEAVSSDGKSWYQRSAGVPAGRPW